MTKSFESDDSRALFFALTLNFTLVQLRLELLFFIRDYGGTMLVGPWHATRGVIRGALWVTNH